MISPDPESNPDRPVAVLATERLAAGYHDRAVVHDVSIEVRAGEVVALLGPNGAGKTTTLKALAGELRPLGGSVLVDGVATRMSLHRRVQAGSAFVTEERAVVAPLSVIDNLRLARADSAFAFRLFPELEPLRRRRAGLLSGGEQQMLALACALGRRPRIILADEVSLGLAPLIVARLLATIREVVTEERLAAVVVEQHVRQAMAIADRVYVMRRGTIVFDSASHGGDDQLETIESLYLSG
jgi:ABC-type branched-subunit amino acid transport system ATPase component